MESYFPFGGDTVSLSKEEQEKMKTMDIAAGIMTLGFAPREKVVKPELCLRPCWLMRPDDTKAKNSSTTFRAFLQVLSSSAVTALSLGLCWCHAHWRVYDCSMLARASVRRKALGRS